MSISIDASDFNELANNLDAAARADLIDQLRPSISKGAQNVKTAWNNDLAGTKWFYGALPVTYDRRDTNEITEATIGPVSAGRVKGDLVIIAHFGGPKGGGSLADPQKYLDDEGPKLEDYAGPILDDLIRSL